MVFGNLGKRVRSSLIGGGFLELQAEILYQAAFVKSSKRMTVVPYLLLADWSAQDFLATESAQLKVLEPWSKEAFRKRFDIWETMFGSDSFGCPENPDALLDLGYSNLNLEEAQSLQAIAKLGHTDEHFIGRGGIMLGALAFPGQAAQQGLLMFKDGAVGAFTTPNLNGVGTPITFALRDIAKCSVVVTRTVPIKFGEHIELTIKDGDENGERISFSLQTMHGPIRFVSWFTADGDAEVARYLQGVAEHLFSMVNDGIALNLPKA